MRLKKIKNAAQIIQTAPCFIKNPCDYKNNWKKAFLNDNPIELEIGMGKGAFIIKKACNNPNINYIGLEKYDSVLVGAIKKLKDMDINNLKIVNEDASNILEMFGKEISKIYLNFSDPWPKKRHAKRRLSHENFLCLYDQVFIHNVNIEMKTDNLDLFEYSLESFKDHGYLVEKIDRNKNDEYKTEYEAKFIKEGKNINYASIYSKSKIE